MLYKLVVNHGGSKAVMAALDEYYVNFPHVHEGNETTFQLDSAERATNMEEHVERKFGSSVGIECFRPECCANCHFHLDNACCRYPPPFPKAEPGQWCGEFRAS